MKTTLFTTIIFVSFALIGCSSSNAIIVPHLSLPVVNESKDVINTVEIRSEKNIAFVVSKAKNILPGEKTILSVPLIDGWNYVISHQGTKFSEKPFFVKNGEITDFVGNKSILDKVILYQGDFQDNPNLKF